MNRYLKLRQSGRLIYILESERKGREERREEGWEGRWRKEEGERMRPDPNGVCLKEGVWGSEMET